MVQSQLAAHDRAVCLSHADIAEGAHGNRVAGRSADEDEAENADADQGWDGLEQAPKNKSRHGSWSLTQARVQGVTQAIAQKVEREDDEGHADGRRQQNPRLVVDRCLSFQQQRAPTGDKDITRIGRWT